MSLIFVFVLGPHPILRLRYERAGLTPRSATVVNYYAAPKVGKDFLMRCNIVEALLAIATSSGLGSVSNTLHTNYQPRIRGQRVPHCVLAWQNAIRRTIRQKS